MKRIISAILICCLILPFLPASAAEEAVAQPSIEEILNEYHEKAFEAQSAESNGGASTCEPYEAADCADDAAEATEDTTTGKKDNDHHIPDDGSSGSSSRIVDFPVQIDPGGNTTVNAVLYTTINGQLCSCDVSYNSSFSMFFGSNTAYNPDIAVISSLLAANAYESNYLNYANMNVNANNSMLVWMNYHSMEDFVCYDLNNYESDQHVTKVYFAHRYLIMNGMIRDIVCVVIRGTNGAEEWESNFDIGTTAESPRHSEWTNINNHKGFDITANRVNELLNTYVATHCSSENSVFWITGHSRGGAIANVLAAKKVDEGKTVFGYTFASPNTTTLSTAQTASKYQCIFNIINTDDYVTKLPMSGWNFRRYGVNKSASIGSQYKTAWQNLTNCTGNLIEGYGGVYNYDNIGVNLVINSLTGIASNRNACYTEHSGTSGYFSESALTASGRDAMRESMLAYYAPNMEGTYRVTNGYENGGYYYRIYQKPTFLMQMLAAYMGGELSLLDFKAIKVAEYLNPAKIEIVAAGLGGMVHPHIVESYYLLATKLT